MTTTEWPNMNGKQRSDCQLSMCNAETITIQSNLAGHFQEIIISFNAIERWNRSVGIAKLTANF